MKAQPGGKPRQERHVSLPSLAKAPVLPDRHRLHVGRRDLPYKFLRILRRPFQVKGQGEQEIHTHPFENLRLVIKRGQKPPRRLLRRQHPDRIRIKGQHPASPALAFAARQSAGNHRLVSQMHAIKDPQGQMMRAGHPRQFVDPRETQHAGKMGVPPADFDTDLPQAPFL